MSNILNMNLHGEEQYQLHAYVCAPGCVHWTEWMGTVSFRWIYMSRPNDCRYAVASKWNEQVLVWDLYSVEKFTATDELITPDPMRVHESVDAAIMATALLYDEKDKT